MLRQLSIKNFAIVESVTMEIMASIIEPSSRNGTRFIFSGEDIHE